VKIDIPRVLVHLRGAATAAKGTSAESLAMRVVARAFGDRRRFERFQRLALRGSRLPGLESLPGPLRGWTRVRNLPTPPDETFRDWWRRERG
jgi:L-lactate dehydrogenase complex protein LldF